MAIYRAGFARRKAIEKENAVARGVELGRARQRPSAHELAAFRAVGLEALLWQGFARGRKQDPNLEQLTLDGV